MKKVGKIAVGLLSTACLTNNVNALDFVYGEDIPVGSESEYVFLEKEETIDAFKDLKEEEANQLKSTLENNYTVVNLKSYKIKTGTTTKDITKSFEKKSKALEYLQSLEDSGIIVDKFEFINNTEVKSSEINELFEEYADALEAYNTFNNEYPDNNNVVLEKIYDETENIVENINKEFDKESDADDYIKETNKLASEDVVVSINKNSSIVAGESITLEEKEFDTLEELNKEIDNINNTYDVVEKINQKTVIAGTVNTTTTITEYLTEYRVNNSKYILIKKGKEIYAWTYNELTKEEQQEFIKTYSEKANDPVLDRKTMLKADVRFIYGENTYSTDNSKMFTFNKDGEIQTIDMNPASVSRVVAGEFEPITKHLLSAVVHNNITKWTVEGTITTKGYDYKVYGSGEKTITLESGELEATITEDVYETVYALDIIRDKFEFVGGIGYGDDPEPEIVNPKTGDNIYWMFTIGGVSLIGLAATSKNYKKEEN